MNSWASRVIVFFSVVIFSVPVTDGDVSVAVAMKINCDLQLTLMASSLYRLLGARIGNGYDPKLHGHRSDHHQRKGHPVRFQKRAHNPVLLAADYANTDVTIPGSEANTYV